jgi:hypothetical protein
MYGLKAVSWIDERKGIYVKKGSDGKRNGTGAGG